MTKRTLLSLIVPSCSTVTGQAAALDNTGCLVTASEAFGRWLVR